MTKASRPSWTWFTRNRSGATTAVWLTAHVRTYQVVWKRRGLLCSVPTKFAVCWISLWFVGPILLSDECQATRGSSVACQPIVLLIHGLLGCTWLVPVWHCSTFSPQAKFRVELPGYPILGDGKGDNQNHAIPFMRGVFTQCIDANQGAYFDPRAAYLGDVAMGSMGRSWCLLHVALMWAHDILLHFASCCYDRIWQEFGHFG